MITAAQAAEWGLVLEVVPEGTALELSAVAVAQSRRTAELRESLAAQATQNQQLRHAAAIEARLTELVVAGASLREVAQGITDLTGKPCAVHDAEHDLLVSASPHDGEPRLLEPAVREHPRSARRWRAPPAGRA